MIAFAKLRMYFEIKIMTSNVVRKMFSPLNMGMTFTCPICFYETSIAIFVNFADVLHTIQQSHGMSSCGFARENIF